MKPKILVIGSSNTDMIIKVARIPGPGETLLGGEFFKVPGGKGANQAVAAARAGGDVVFVGCLGNDAFGKEALEGLKNEGIDVSSVKISDNMPSGVALINVSSTGENSISVASGANSQFFPEDAKALDKLIDSSSIILLQHEIPFETIKTVIELAFFRGVAVILNPAPAMHLPSDLLAKVFLLTPNEHEAALILESQKELPQNPSFLAKELLKKGCKQVIITLGAKGSLYASSENEYLVESYPVSAIDSTAAGDTFNGYLAVALANGENIPKAIKWASKAASISVTRMGAQSSIPYLQELI